MSEEPTNLVAALGYAERGWSVLPVHSAFNGLCSCGDITCPRVAKHPMTARGVKDATTEPERIRAWWQSWPHANVGIATGRVSGIFVLDVDVHGRLNGQETLADLQLSHERLPDTACAATGGGGFHYYFLYPTGGDIKSGVGRLGPGLDARSDGGYVVAPPSIHATSEQYQWRNDVPVAQAPAWLVGLMQGGAGAVEEGQPYQELLGGVAEGERNASAAVLAGHYLAMGLPGPEVGILLKAWNQRNTPPLADEEIERVVVSIARRELLKRGKTEPQGEGDRANALQALSERFGVRLDDIVRVCGHRPFYVFTVGPNDVTLPAELMASHSAWVRAITAAAECVPREIPRKAETRWSDYANLMMRIARRVDPGASATQRGSVTDWLSDYMDRYPPVPNGEVEWEQSTVLHNGRLYIHARRFHEFLAASGIRMKSTETVQLMALYGATKTSLRVNSSETGKSWVERVYLLPKGFQVNGAAAPIYRPKTEI